ncbi:hypothetical protein CONPUDRAFT_132017 [Coniophora puteana RWD-64-598 SS2]|uniref:BTB domain-containing protein n=1 Tax=Coniophora puteana (strain RWD-64-598) TaxID=741705 RepID=A0A5M3M7R7_CONPW|nr:uncharacterized protein CONPUDRAFT_132017 [Coniophora puteana RWD-64-598 SS2]EIW75083.1 hypothetical protein CONPUDRAFT_132017 [Coniophora puteana RWD-64-598 SS2]
MSVYNTGTEALPPFNSAAKGDIVLRSSDAVHFRVFRCLLALASPFFDAMFDLPQPQPATVHGRTTLVGDLDVIPMTENGRTVDAMLRYCYPAASVPLPALETLEDVEQVLEGAIKYGMEGVEQQIRKLLVSPRFLDAQPLHVFAIATRLALEPEARLAARHLLQAPLPLPLPKARAGNEIQRGTVLPAADLARLHKYRARCTHAAQTLLANLASAGPRLAQSYAFYQWWTAACACPTRSDARAAGYMMHGTYARAWWADWLDGVRDALAEAPCGATAGRDVDKVVEERCAACPRCRRKAHAAVSEFASALAGEIDRAVEQVEL